MKLKSIILIILGILLIAVSCFAETYTWRGDDGEIYTLVVQGQGLLMVNDYATSYYYSAEDFSNTRPEDIFTEIKAKCEKDYANYKNTTADMKAEAAKIEVE